MDYGLGGYKTINAYVNAKLARFASSPKTFATMFDLMFSERENIMYEASEGYRIKKTTYGESRDRILVMAGALRAALPGREGGVIGLCMENSLLWIESFWAALAAGFSPLLLNLRLPDGTLRDALRTVGASAVISEKRDFGLLRVDPASLSAGAPVEPGDFGGEILVMSSGTTENVKICAFTAEEFYCQIIGSADLIKRCRVVKKHCGGSLKLLDFLPFYHVFGLIAVYIWFAFFSRTFVHLADLSPETIVNTIRRHRVTHIFAVPLFWEKTYSAAMKTIKARGEKTENKFLRAVRLWEKLPDGVSRAFSRVAFREVRDNLFGDSVRFMITGGSAVPAGVMRFFNAVGYRLADGYGMTEIGITSFETSGKKKYLLGRFVGEPMKNAEYRIGEDGELLVRGGVVARYIIEGGVKKKTEGWFSTRDLAVCEDGHYRIEGRRDDLIVGPEGENLNPNLIEPLVAPSGSPRVCLVGVPTPDGEKTVLLVEVGPFATREKLSAIDAETREKIASSGLSSMISRVAYITAPLLNADEFKLNRRRLSAEYRDGKLPEKRLTDRDDGGELDALAARVRTHFAAALGREDEEIAPDADFFLDCGGTSIDYFAMMTAITSEFGVPMPGEEKSGPVTVRSLSEYITRSGGV
ncbi:MAG: non-ribosomal peptide synthetase [Clostridia bacterium]|nr:non-ribosomal peptide synthetase [Clostridia bacterium]